MTTRRDFLRMGARATTVAALGAVVPLSAAAGAQDAGAVTFSSVEELMRFRYAAHRAAHLKVRLHAASYATPPLAPERRAAMMDAYTALNREQFQYKMMRLNQPNIVDRPETLTEVARLLREPVEEFRRWLPWHNLPKDPFVVMPSDGGFLATTDSVAMLYVAATRTYCGY